MTEYRPRPDDRLVEPMFAALEPQDAEGPPAGAPRPRPRRARAPRAWLVAALVAAAALAGIGLLSS